MLFFSILLKKFTSPPEKILHLSTLALKSQIRRQKCKGQKPLREERRVLLCLSEEWQLFLPQTHDAVSEKHKEG